MKRIIKAISAASLLAVTAAHAVTPSGSWTLNEPTPDVRDYFLRVDVDPGEAYPNQSDFAPSSVYYAQYLPFQNAAGGYFGLQRAGGKKIALVSIWQDKDQSTASQFGAKAGALAVADCHEFGACTSIKGEFNWLVGHQYRFRVMRSPSGANWWRVVLTDLTTSTAHVLGEIRTPSSWGGLSQQSGLFLEFFWGPYQCDTLRHTRATYMPPQGNFGRTTTLSQANGDSYQGPHGCNTNLTTPDMSFDDIESSSRLDSNNNVIGVGNAYRGVHPWPNSSKTAVSGVMYSPQPTAKHPTLYRAIKSGRLGSMPTGSKSNTDWQYVGRGYPVINDLFMTGRRVFDWSERGSSQSKIGDIFAYDNPYTGDLEYFRKNIESPWYFPANKTSSEHWTYLGRHSVAGESVKKLVYQQWGSNNRTGRVGSLYRDQNGMVFRLKTSGQYWYLPTSAADNDWWEFVGYQATP